MKERYFGLDFLRGLGVATVITLHSAFYRFGGLFDLDLSNPPAIVTVIGLLLMFAGLFAMLSGVSHGIRAIKILETGTPKTRLALRFLAYAGLTFIVAYAYFLFTGPGIIHFDTRSMDSSLLVSLIDTGYFPGWSLDRLLYVDSLVMIALNLLVMALLAPFALKSSKVLALAWIALFGISILRIPLYNIYLAARDSGDMAAVLALNWIVGKNNPLLPYAAFAAAGLWIAALVREHEVGGKKPASRILPPALILFAAGIFAYMTLPDTMLERSIDAKWYAIMTAQLGLFMLLIFGALNLWTGGKERRPGLAARFVARFGVAGLTPFFLESVFSILIFKALRLFVPNLSFGIGTALAYGFALMLLWGFLLAVWERFGYRYGIEYWLAKAIDRIVPSDKSRKLRQEAR